MYWMICDASLSHRRNKFLPILFERLNVVNLPPPFPLKQSDQLSRDELWTLLQNSGSLIPCYTRDLFLISLSTIHKCIANDTFQQAFPTTIVGDNPFAKAFMEKGCLLMRFSMDICSVPLCETHILLDRLPERRGNLRSNIMRQPSKRSTTICRDRIQHVVTKIYSPLRCSHTIHYLMKRISKQLMFPVNHGDHQNPFDCSSLWKSRQKSYPSLGRCDRMVELRGGTQGFTMPGHASAVS